MEDGGNGQEGFGVHSLHGKGLGYYAPLLCERVRAKGTTTYNDVRRVFFVRARAIERILGLTIVSFI